MSDILGFDNNVAQSGNIASSKFAATVIGGTLALVQQFSVNYGLQVETIHAAGDTQVYWQPGRPQGQITASKLTGNGFFNDWKGFDCGRIENLAVDVNGGECGYKGSGTMTFGGGIVTQLGMSFQSQPTSITENIGVQIAHLAA